MPPLALRFAGPIALLLSLVGCSGDDAPPRPSFMPLIHRAVPATCALVTRPPSNNGAGGACMTDAECTVGIAGRCQNLLGGGCCTYHECETDGDCSMGMVCECGVGPGSQNVCIRADCVTDADCPGGLCARTSGRGYGLLSTGGPMYACTTGEEPCAAGDTCARGDGGLGYCDLDYSGAWECVAPASDGDWFCTR